MNCENRMIQVIFIEDDRQITDTVLQHLSNQPDITVIATYGSIEDFKKEALLMNHTPDVVLLDIVLPNMSGIEGIHLIKERWPTTNVIIFSVMDDGFNLFRSLCEGAVGYLTKDVPLLGVTTAIRDVYEGKGIMSPSIARKVAEYFHPKKSMHDMLTSREMDIVNGIIDGLSYKLIADRLNISIDTVRKHIKNVYRKLHINSKSQLLQQYFK
jgi:DNA-binding NarL/FixJ family response regulator